MNEFFTPKAFIESDSAARIRQAIEDDLVTNIEVQDHFQVPSQASIEYTPQIAEPGGLNTCQPTSILNGWIHQGMITQSEAANAQLSFKAENNTLFAHRPDLGVDVWTVPPDKLIGVVHSLSGKKAHLDIFKISELDSDSLKKVILQELSKSNVIVSGDSSHAVLVVGYDQGGENLILINPLSPQNEEKTETWLFIQKIQESGYSYITVIPQDQG